MKIDKEDAFLLWFAVLLLLLCVSMGFYTYTTSSPQKAASYIIHEEYKNNKGLDIKTESQDHLK